MQNRGGNMQKSVKVCAGGGGESSTPEETSVRVPTADVGPCQASGTGRVWPETGGQRSGTVTGVEQQRSPHVWTWDRAWGPRFGETEWIYQ